jgi:hypothetical protein
MLSQGLGGDRGSWIRLREQDLVELFSGIPLSLGLVASKDPVSEAVQGQISLSCLELSSLSLETALHQPQSSAL